MKVVKLSWLVALVSLVVMGLNVPGKRGGNHLSR
jgi:hypothetical protein